MSDTLDQRRAVAGALDDRQSVDDGQALITAPRPDTRDAAPDTTPEVSVPRSPEQAIAAFGDGTGVTVIGGGTVLMPRIARGTLRPRHALLLHVAGMDAVSADATSVTLGATATLQAVADAAPEPLAAAARIPDREIRAQATLGGNLHWPGDLQAPLIALRARVRSAGTGGEREDAIEDYLTAVDSRLALAVTCERPLAGAYVAQRRVHSATYTVASIAVARFADGIAVAAGGAGPHGVRCPSVEAALAGGADPSTAAAEIAADVDPPDDPLASAWYRRRILPVLVTRALALLEERS